LIVRRQRIGCVAGLSMVLALLGCSSAAMALPEGTISQFSIPSSESAPGGLAPGPEGNLWFTEYRGEKIGAITPSGAISEFSIPTEKARPEGIAPGPDGNLWFTERKGNKIGMITPSGAISEFAIPTTESEPEAITLGPDGNLWFTEYKGNKIGRITPAGSITEFPLPSGESGPLGIASGPDGNLWFTEYKQDQIGRITPNGSIIEFPMPSTESGPWRIASGPDGNLWFTEFNGDRIGRITPNGVFTEFPLPSAASLPTDIAPGPDGDIWFIEYKGNKVGRITPSGTITESPLPSAESGPSGLSAGPDGNMWFAESNTGSIGRIGTGAPEAPVSAPVVTGGGRVGTPQACDTLWSSWDSLQPSATLFGFDGYRWLLDGTQIATGQSYTPTREQVGQPLSCSETATYPLLDVTASASSAPVGVIAPPPPAITDVHQSASRWREGSKLAHASRRGTKPPAGTTVSFVLSENASVGFTFTQLNPGCRAKGHKHSEAKNCGRTTTAGKLSFDGHSGTNKVSFQGRISRARELKPGNYTLTIIAIDAEGAHSASKSLRFAITPNR
jgi:streptogramin lyase